MDASRTGGVVFDLDGTLYEPPFLMKPRVALKLLGDLSILRHVNAARDRVREQSFEDGDALRSAFHSELGRRAGIDAGRAATWYEERFIATFLEVLGRSARARPGLSGLLAGLRKRGLRTAVLSDYGRVAERVEGLRIPVTLFDDLSSAEDSGALKPSPRPFLMSASNLGLEPGSVLVVGDRDDMDGEGARAAGMRFLGLGRGPGMQGWPEVREMLGTLEVTD